MDLTGMLLFWHLLLKTSACSSAQTVGPVVCRTVKSMMDGRGTKGRKMVGSKGEGKKDPLTPLPP